MMTAPPRQDEEQQRPLGELFGELAHETATLVKKEVELAKVEMTSKARKATFDIAQIAVGGVIALLGSMALLAAIILMLSTVLQPWAAALIVGLFVSVLGAVLVSIGLRAFKQIDPAPRQTIQTLEDNKQWLTEQVSR
jgi:uncharacterized membrane protein YqjE